MPRPYNRVRNRTDLSAHYVRSILAYDPETGALTWKNRADIPSHLDRRHAGKRAGGPDDYGRWQVKIDNVSYYAARLAWLIMIGEWPDFDVDHRNRVASDDSWENLRAGTPHQNMLNRGVRKDSRSGVKNVYQRPSGRWAARISTASGRLFLGTFDTQNAAFEVYKAVEEREYGEWRPVP